MHDLEREVRHLQLERSEAAGERRILQATVDKLAGKGGGVDPVGLITAIGTLLSGIASGWALRQPKHHNLASGQAPALQGSSPRADAPPGT
jgi:hypothetical protein